MENISKNELSNLKKLLLLFPPLYIIHDIEEILTVEKFLIEHSTTLPFRVTTLEFAFAFSLLWIFASIGCYRAFFNRSFIGMKPTTYLSFLVPGILLANSMGHLLQFIVFKDYVPGIITSTLIVFPYSFLTVKFLITKRLLTIKRFLSYLFLGFVLQAPLALIAHYISKLTFTLLFN